MTDKLTLSIDQLVSGDLCGEDSPIFVCPFCGFENTHIEESQWFPQDNWNYGRVVIPFWGECGHEWLLTITSHEGMVYLEASVKPTKKLFEPEPSTSEVADALLAIADSLDKCAAALENLRSLGKPGPNYETK